MNGSEVLREDVKTISLVALAHGLSHFFQIATAVVFPLIKDDLDVSYVALGGTVALFYVVSGIFQTVSGFATGATGPSRDMIVRASTPPGATGKVYGFVYSGLDVGSMLTPLYFGWLLDGGRPAMVFYTVVVTAILTIATVLNLPARRAEAKAA